MQTTSRKLFIIGISTLIAVVILVFGIDYLKGINIFHTSNYYYVSYTNVTGLSVSAPVHANGFKIGQVRSMEYEYDNPGHVLVELALDSEFKVPEGTVAALVTDMLGTATIDLDTPLTDKYIPIGSSIPSKQGGGLMENISSDLLPSVAALMPKVDSLLTAVTTLAADPALLASIKRLDAITANLEATTAQVSAACKPLPAITANARTLTDNLASMTAHLDSVSAAIEQMPLDATMQNVLAITNDLRHLTAELQSRDSSLGLLLNDPALYNNLNATVESLDSLFVDIKAHPKRYLKFSVF